MASIPTIEELRKKYQSLMNNEEITLISKWTEPNSSMDFDEEKYLTNMGKNAPILSKKLDEALKNIPEGHDHVTVLPLSPQKRGRGGFTLHERRKKVVL